MSRDRFRPFAALLIGIVLVGCRREPETPPKPPPDPKLLERAAELAERARTVVQSASDAAGEMRRFRYVESGQFQKRITARLNPYRRWFEQAGERFGVDWRLLAAMAYQESRWDPLAKSADGALGIMMLTESTARSLGVTDRENPRQSIFAGARYFAQMHAKIPARVPEPDRTWLAVAAYNVGYGHLEDARVITQTLRKNPDSWDDVREHLPLLETEKWYLQVKRGYARGSEPVQFVARVQRFLTLLDWETSEGTVLDEVISVDADPGS